MQILKDKHFCHLANVGSMMMVIASITPCSMGTRKFYFERYYRSEWEVGPYCVTAWDHCKLIGMLITNTFLYHFIFQTTAKWSTLPSVAKGKQQKQLWINEGLSQNIEIPSILTEKSK